MLSFAVKVEAQTAGPTPEVSSDPSPQPSPTILPTPLPTPEPSPSPTPESTPTPQPTPTPEPTSQPSPTPTPDSGDVGGQSTVPTPTPSPSPSPQPKPILKVIPKLPPQVGETLNKISGPPLNFLFRENPRPYYYSPNLISPGGSLALVGLGFVFVLSGVVILATSEFRPVRQSRLSGVIYL